MGLVDSTEGCRRGLLRISETFVEGIIGFMLGPTLLDSETLPGQSIWDRTKR